MDSFLSNIFPWMGHQQKLARAAAISSTKVETHLTTSVIIPQSMTVVDTSVDEMDVSSNSTVGTLLSSPEMTNMSRKRNRRISTPTLIHTGSTNGNTAQSIPSAIVTPCHSDIDDDSSTLFRPKKIFRGTKHFKLPIADASRVPDIVCEHSSRKGPIRSGRSSTTTAYVQEEARRVKILSETPLDLLPEDIVAHTLSFVNGISDRFALQCTSKQFHRICSTPIMMHKINVGGDPKTGINGIILDSDTTETAANRLAPFAASGNLEAMYMLGIINSYCDCDVENGIALLKMASSQGFVRASYALGLVLRDSAPEDAYRYMIFAADQKYLPALQELLPAVHMKAKYGEPNADVLRGYLDPLCLNRLLSRNYLLSAKLRSVNTSHCWNHLCGRWAYKTSSNTSSPISSTYETVRNPPRPTSHHRRSASTITSESTSSSPSSFDTATSRGASESPKNRVSRMKMCSRCCRAKYCSKLCQVYDWRSGRHKMECHFL